MSQDKQHSSPLEFPCDFVIKMMGKDGAEFETVATDIITQFFPTTDLSTFSKRPSKDGNYLALTISVHATSQAQLDKLYQALSDAPDILVAL